MVERSESCPPIDKRRNMKRWREGFQPFPPYKLVPPFLSSKKYRSEYLETLNPKQIPI